MIKVQIFLMHFLCICLRAHVNFIQGNNGAGKSTLFRIIQGTTAKDECVQGTISLDGQEFKLNETNNQLSGQVGLVHQQVSRMLIDSYNLKENLQCAQLPAYPFLTRLPSAQPPTLISDFGIDPDIPVRQLSGGQRQILAILMALAQPKKVLLLDEPTAALDENNAKMVMQFLKELIEQKNIICLIIAHDQELIKMFATNIYVLKRDKQGSRSIQKTN